MAITPFALRLIAPYLSGRVLSFGYPDLLMPPEQASAILGVPLYKTTPFAGSHKLTYALADTTEAFSAAGGIWTCMDLFPTRGPELVIDLNATQNDIGQFDLVIDAGTIEHCANVGQALMNCAKAVTPGGHIFHSPPLSMANHGFYNISPTLLMDFYEQNGWRVIHFSGFSVRPPYDPIVIQRRTRFSPPDGVALYFLAQRISEASLHWPVQHKYLKDAA